jgi:integrase
MRAAVRYRERRGGYFVRWGVAEGRLERGGFGHGPKARASAERFAREVEAAEAAGDVWAAGPDVGGVTVDELVRGWAEVHGPLRSERTRVTDRARVERLAEAFGGIPAHRLGVSRVARFASDLMGRRSAWTVVGHLATLRRVLNLAVKDGVLERNPVPELGDVIRSVRERGREEVARPTAWTREEAEALLELAVRYEPGFAPALRVAFGTGMRRGELLALRWEDVDEGGGRLVVRRTLKLGGAGTKAPKSGRERFTPLSPSVAAVLALQRERRRRTLVGVSPWCFPSPRGGLWSENAFSRTWYRLRRRAEGSGVRPLKFHSTRHTFITWALEAGTSAKRVSEWVGASVQVLERHYAHVLPLVDADLSFAELCRGAVTSAEHGPLVERVRIAEHALSEFKKDRERTERAFYESAKSERDALQAEVERLKVGKGGARGRSVEATSA